MTTPEDEHTLAKVPGAGLPITATEPIPVMISRRYIEETVKSLALLQEMVRDVLVDGRDYGNVPGVRDKFLWDPGASQITGSFNCFPGHRRVLSLIDDGTKIAVVIEVPLIQRGSLQEVGSGIGASTTMEIKHKRWVLNPPDAGYHGDAISSLKTRQKDGKTEYRIPNPDHDDLLNTIIKQASKRAEVDAAEALPGVAAALREMFSPGGAGEEAGPRWTKFWSAARDMMPGIENYRAETHRLLGVKTMKDWLTGGRSLDDAIRKLSEVVQKKPPAAPPQRRDPNTVTEAELDGATALQQVIFDCFGWHPLRLWSEANYANRFSFEEGDRETAWQLFQRMIPIARDQERPPQDG